MYGFSLRFIDYTAGRGRGHRVSLNGRILYFRSRSILYFALYNCNIRSRWHTSYHSRHSFTRDSLTRSTTHAHGPRRTTTQDACPTHAPHHAPRSTHHMYTMHTPRTTIHHTIHVFSRKSVRLLAGASTAQSQ